jgi:hypothetical protein
VKLPNELTEDKSASFALSWSLSWRFFVVAFVVGSVSYFIPHELRFEYSISLTILTLFVTFILFWLWAHRLLKKGIGRVKIVFMERKHYDELKEKIYDQTKL